MKFTSSSGGVDINQSYQNNYGTGPVSPKAFNSNHKILPAEGAIGLVESQQKLNKHLQELMQFADLNNSLIPVTNQVMDMPDTFFADPAKSVSGHVLGIRRYFGGTCASLKVRNALLGRSIRLTCSIARRCSLRPWKG